MDKAKVIVFNDGTLASKVLEYECKKNESIDVESIEIKADPKNIENYIKKAEKKDATLYVPFTMEDFSKNDIYTQMNAIATKYPNIRVFYAYEYMSSDAVKSRAMGYGLDKKPEAEPKADDSVKEKTG